MDLRERWACLNASHTLQKWELLRQYADNADTNVPPEVATLHMLLEAYGNGTAAVHLDAIRGLTAAVTDFVVVYVKDREVYLTADGRAF